MASIHATAVVSPEAQIADDALIGPYCIIGPHVEIGAACQLIAHVHVTGRTAIGARTIVHPFASLGGAPQSLKYRGQPTRLVIGADCDIREHVTMNIGTEEGGGVTRVGHHGMFMVGCHVAHDCQIGDHVILANAATLGGHCRCGDHVFLGGLSGVHQFTRIGAHAMIAGMTGLQADVIPFGTAIGVAGRLGGLNMVGMRRRGFSSESRHRVRAAYRTLFFSDAPFSARIEDIEARLGNDPAVAQILAFVKEDGSRPLCRPRGPAGDQV